MEDRQGVGERTGTHLSASGSILCGSASDELGVAVLEQVLVYAHVLFLGEYCVVGLEAIFFEHGFISK